MTALHELRDRCADLARDGGMAVHEAVDKVLASEDVDGETLEALARTGLRYLVDKELSAARGRGPEDGLESDGLTGSRSGRWQHRPATADKSARFYWLAKHYNTADGGQRPLLDHTEADLAHCQEWAQVQAREHQDRADFFARCRDELGQHSRAKKLSDLPLTTLAELDGVAASVLGGLR